MAIWDAFMSMLIRNKQPAIVPACIVEDLGPSAPQALLEEHRPFYYVQEASDEEDPDAFAQEVCRNKGGLFGKRSNRIIRHGKGSTMDLGIRKRKGKSTYQRKQSGSSTHFASSTFVDFSNEKKRVVDCYVEEGDGFRQTTAEVMMHRESNLLGRPPTREELEAASRDLCQNFFQDNQLKHLGSSNLAAGDTHLNLSTGLSQQSDNMVEHCVNVFRQNQDIQAAVMSLANDPAIWDAFARNDKVQELIRNRGSNYHCHQLQGIAHEDYLNSIYGGLAFGVHMIREVLNAFVDLSCLLFRAIERKIYGDKSDSEDHTFKTCMVITILILTAVMLHRIPLM